MSGSVQNFFSGLAEHFSSGELSGIAGHFSFPTAIYFQDKVMVFDTQEEMMKAHHLYRLSLQNAGHIRTDCNVVAQSLTRGDRKSVWVQWSHFKSGEVLLGKSFIRFFMSHTKGQPVTIMLAEYLDVPSQVQPHDLPLNPRSGTDG